MVETPTSRSSRTGKRAPGITILSVPIHVSLKRRIRVIARNRKTTSAAWVREKLQDLVRRSEASQRGTAEGSR